MNKIMTAIALTISLPAAALAQQSTPEAEPAMPCCERDTDGNMTGCDCMDDDNADHQHMDHGDMDHDTMEDQPDEPAPDPAAI